MIDPVVLFEINRDDKKAELAPSAAGTGHTSDENTANAAPNTANRRAPTRAPGIDPTVAHRRDLPVEANPPERANQLETANR
jgi:hypothetical protein